MTISSTSLSNKNNAANNSDKTSMLMIILTDRIRMFLQSDQMLGNVQKEDNGYW